MKVFSTTASAFKSTFMVINFFALYRTIQLYCYDFRTAIGPSMIPTIREGKVYVAGDLLLVDKITPRFKAYKIGDIVIARSPMKLNSILCKRVVATAGQYAVVDGVRYLVPEDHIWLEGDNKDKSFDSRNFGPVPLALIEGRVAAKFWRAFTVY